MRDYNGLDNDHCSVMLDLSSVYVRPDDVRPDDPESDEIELNLSEFWELRQRRQRCGGGCGSHAVRSRV